MLDAQLRRRLIEALCARYPNQSAFDKFLSLTQGRRLPHLSAPDGLPVMVFNVVVAAEAGGWDGDLIEAAADDSPKSLELAAIRAVYAERTRPTPEPVVVPPPPLDLALIAPRFDRTLSAALRADPRVGTVATAADVLAAADALVVSTAADWPVWASAALAPAPRHLPVVLVEPPTPRARGTRPGVAAQVAERVTQIVVLDDPADAVRRIVDHLSVVLHSRA